MKNQTTTGLMKLDSSFKVAIKNVKLFECNYGIAAYYDVFINGVRAFHVNDEANGGAYVYTIFNEELTNKFKKAVEALPMQNVFNSMMKVDMDMALALIHEAQVTGGRR
jgi:hypothetical protein